MKIKTCNNIFVFNNKYLLMFNNNNYIKIFNINFYFYFNFKKRFQNIHFNQKLMKYN